MKKVKYLILLLPFLATGCLGLSGSGILTTTCTRTESSYTLEDVDIYKIEYKEGDITNVTLTKNYNGVDLTTSLITYQKAYENSTGVHITINENSIIYNFDMSKITNDEIKKSFNLKTTYNEQIRALKEIGFTCE